jgi:CTP:molybdopterin cytidylyltransferase MocA
MIDPSSTNAARRPFAVPVFKGKNGHPLLIPHEYFREILSYKGDGGLKAIRSKYDTDMIRFETEDAGCVLDMDTPDDYKMIIEYDKTGKY